jgi:hypothetical protein
LKYGFYESSKFFDVLKNIKIKIILTDNQGKAEAYLKKD